MSIRSKVIIIGWMITVPIFLSLITLLSGEEKMSDQDLKRYVQNRRSVVQQLLSVVRRNIKSPSEATREIIIMLGELRAEEAAEFLVDNIKVMPPGTFEKTTKIVYPAVGALIHIGYPSVQVILNKGFLRERSDLEQKLMAHVIRSVLGQGYQNSWEVGTRLGRLIIQEHLCSAKPPAPVRERLVKFMEKHFPTEKPIKRR